MRRLLASALALALFPALVFAQSSPNFQAGQTLKAAGLNAAFQNKQDYKVNLSSLGNLNVNGFPSLTSPGVFTARSLLGTSGQVVVTNGDGVAGNPTISLDPNIPRLNGVQTWSGNQVWLGAWNGFQEVSGNAALTFNTLTVSGRWWNVYSTDNGSDVNLSITANATSTAAGNGIMLNGATGATQIIGKIVFSGNAPSMGPCGTSPVVTSGSTSNRGSITTGSGTVTQCGVSFYRPFPYAPFCVVTGEDGTMSNAGLIVQGTSAGGFTVASNGTDIGGGHPFNYICL